MTIRLLNRKFYTTLVAIAAIVLQCDAVYSQVPNSGASSKELFTYVTVTDNYGRFISGLNVKHFFIELDNFPQTIKSFSEVDEATTVGILVDKSMSAKNLDSIFPEALSRFVSQSNSSNEYFVTAFNTTQAEFLDFSQEENNVIPAIKKLLLMPSTSNTAFYDAVADALTKLERARFKKRVLLIASDCEDNDSKLSIGKLVEMAKRSEVLIYIIGLDVNRGSTIATQAQSDGDRLARLSGGGAIFPQTVDALNAVSEQLALGIRNQYKIGFEPMGKNGPLAENKWYDLDIKSSFRFRKNDQHSDGAKKVYLWARAGIYLIETKK